MTIETIIRILEDLVSEDPEREQRAIAALQAMYALPREKRAYHELDPLLKGVDNYVKSQRTEVEEEDIEDSENEDEDEEEKGLPAFLSEEQAVKIGRSLKGGWSALGKLAGYVPDTQFPTPSYRGDFTSTRHPYGDIIWIWELMLHIRSSAQFLEDLRKGEPNLSRPLSRLENLHVKLMENAIKEQILLGNANWDDIVRFARWQGQLEFSNSATFVLTRLLQGDDDLSFIPREVLATLFAINPHDWAYWAGMTEIPLVAAMSRIDRATYHDGVKFSIVIKNLSPGLHARVDEFAGRTKTQSSPTVEQAQAELTLHEGKEHYEFLQEFLLQNHKHDMQEQPDYTKKCSWCGKEGH